MSETPGGSAAPTPTQNQYPAGQRTFAEERVEQEAADRVALSKAMDASFARHAAGMTPGPDGTPGIDLYTPYDLGPNRGGTVVAEMGCQRRRIGDAEVTDITFEAEGAWPNSVRITQNRATGELSMVDLKPVTKDTPRSMLAMAATDRRGRQLVPETRLGGLNRPDMWIGNFQNATPNKAEVEATIPKPSRFAKFKMLGRNALK